MVNILMIEDDTELAELLKEYLAKFNMIVTNYESPIKGLQAIEKTKFDLLILDLSLPELDGIEVCKKIANNSIDIPIIISSARSDYSDKVLALELAADDYLAKPYNPRELVARIQALLRRVKKPKNLENKKSDFQIDENEMTIIYKNNKLSLTSAEYEVLALFLKNKNRVLTRDFILENTKTMDYESIDRSVDVIVSRIRKKINDDPKEPRYIKSIRGLGYKFVE
ncbi:MAG: response regulator transcription factor [Desulfurella sp.]|uniref:Two-component system, OmpR family, response regulator n=1 Tax=Desulfurella multipotens TaxID=79269 RepID=A0A1G6N5N9_9BACT|nr:MULTISPECIES: response regulator transcription factor [Desulfurella]AHF97597.1 chemotaxis protein CheY [Desulfurella acetivorans A63]PMP93255.1 MAG: DNA-binding response regulator [Desulfurella sp.]SDC62991.1 two-component system, OmpR family, response regulator [Desulfurella multipotens]HEX13769.1 response regulator transcription factor [Desulfurella acetivorans]